MTEAPNSPSSVEVVQPHRGSASSNLTGKAVVAAWIISILVHVMLFGVLITLVFQQAGDTSPPRPHVRAELLGDPESRALSSSDLPNLSSAEAAAQTAERQFTPKPLKPLSALDVQDKPDLPIIGIGSGGGDFSQYGLSGGQGKGPDFFGLGGGSTRGVRSVIYVVDISGSMEHTFEFVREELQRSISALRRNQKFHVIFFNKTPLESPPKRLVNAVRAHRKQFFDFLETVTPSGGTKPWPALRRALELKPDIIYLLSDGSGYRSGLLGRLDQWNPDRHTRIFTIAYLDQTGAEILERIALEHNGEFLYVSDDDVLP